MKGTILTLLLLGVVGSANAAPSFPRMDVRELAVDISTANTINISSITYTSVISAWGTYTNIWAIEVYVPSSEKTVNCGFDVNVSTIPTSASYGREVAPATSVLWQADFNSGKNILYCRSSSQTASDTRSRATVTLFR